MGSDGSINPARGTMTRYASGPPSHRISVVGDSIIQFISFAVSRDVLEGVRRTFYQDGTGTDAILQSFAPGAEVPADVSARAFTVDGGAAADTFVDEWLPMACLRRGTHHDSDASAPLDGPTNWVRLRLVRDDRGFRVVLAFDTWLADPAAKRGRGDVSLTLDDARNRVRFAFAAELAELEHFMSEPWVDDWICEPPPSSTAQPKARTLLRLAHYMTLLAALQSAGLLPDVEITGSAAGKLGESESPREVDLAITLGDDDCAAYMVDVVAFDNGAPSAVVPLAIRDLDRPWLAHPGPAPGAVAFARPHLGREALSRLSGRTDAFVWPSLVRGGHAAHEICLRQFADAPHCGRLNVMSGVLDDRPNDAVWRIAGDGSSAHGRLPFVSGSLLALLTETGDRVASGTGRTPATRARFSHSALTSLAIHELVVQAIAAANQADLNAEDTRPIPTRIRSILVTLPDRLQSFERDVAQQRIRDGVALAYDALRWPATSIPTVAFASTRAQSAQYAYLHNEISHRFSGRAPAYLRLLAGPVRPAGADVKIAALDLTASGLALDISTVTSSDDAHLALRRSLDDTAGVGLDDVALAIARRCIIPALIQHLEKARLAQAAKFLRQILEKPQAHTADAFADRLVRETFLPAALGLLSLHHKSGIIADTVVIETTVRTLLGANIDHVGLQRLQDLAIAEGANATSLLEVSVASSAAGLRTIVSDVLGGAVRAACRTIRRSRCSLLLLTGHNAVVGFLRDVALSEATVTPDRIVDLTTYRFAPWAGRAHDPAAVRAAGSVLASRHQDSFAPEPLTQVLAFDSGPSGRSPIFAIDPKSTSPGERSHIFAFDGTARLIGVSRINAQDWPLRPLGRLQISDGDAVRRAALPLTVTLVLKPTTAISPDAIEIRSVRDSRGRQLPPTVLELRRATLRTLDILVDDLPVTRANIGGLA